MTINPYDLGDIVRISAAFAVDGTPTDPTTLTATYRSPAGVKTTLTYGVDSALEQDSVGNYHLDVTASLPGTWRYRFAGTGLAAGVGEGQFFVRASLVP